VGFSKLRNFYLLGMLRSAPRPWSAYFFCKITDYGFMVSTVINDDVKWREQKT